MSKIKLPALIGMLSVLFFGTSCVKDHFKEIEPAYSEEYDGSEIKTVRFQIIDTIDDEGDVVATKSTLTTNGFVWSEKDTVGIFPSKGNQIFYEMSAGAGTTNASFDGGGWALKQGHSYWSYYPLKGDFYLKKNAIPVEYPTVVKQNGNDNPAHLGPNAYMYTSSSTVKTGTLNFKYWQIGSVLKPRVTLPAGNYTKLVLSTDTPIFVVSGTYDITTAMEDDPNTSINEKHVPVVVPDKDDDGIDMLTNELTIELENVVFTQETELIAYIMSAPVDVSNIPITVTIYADDAPKYRYEYVRESTFVAQTNHNIRPNDKGLMNVANSAESANEAFANGVTSLTLFDIPAGSELDLTLPATSDPVNISAPVSDDPYTITVSYPSNSTAVPLEISVQAPSGSELVLDTPQSTVTLDGQYYESVRAATASNTLIIPENVTVGTLYLEKGNVEVYGTIEALNTDDLQEGEKPVVTVYGTIEGQVDDDAVSVVVHATGISLDRTNLVMEIGDRFQIKANLTPANATPSIEWSTSDPKVATVDDNGEVTAVRSGTVIITAKTIYGGFTAACTVTVNEFPYEYVDLGLPSGIKWATMNVGATTPEGYGDYFAWGETEPYYQSGFAQENPQLHWKAGKTDGYYSTSYKYCNNNSIYNLTKYCSSSSNGDNGFTDEKIILRPEDDAASVNWGDSWRMPTEEEFMELTSSNNCTWTWISFNGVYGYKVQSKIAGYTDNWIFLPAGSSYSETLLNDIGSTGSYWSSSLEYYRTYLGRGFYFRSDYRMTSTAYRFYGRMVRPVYTGASNDSGITGIILDKTNISLYTGLTESLKATVLKNSNAINTQVEWTSSDPSVATVDYAGKISPVAAGVTTITARTVFGGFTATCTVTVQGDSDTIYNGREYVDLGIEIDGNRILWATTNVGAETPTDCGDYFAWGETKPYYYRNSDGSISWSSSNQGYHFSNYKYAIVGSSSSYLMTKYNLNFLNSNTKDDIAVLEPIDDAATVNWGGSWRTPTREEILLLRTECVREIVESYNGVDEQGVIIYRAKSDEDKGKYTSQTTCEYSLDDPHIFLPTAGYYRNKTLESTNFGYYWSSTVTDGTNGALRSAYVLDFNFQYFAWLDGITRDTGCTVRAVFAR